MIFLRGGNSPVKGSPENQRLQEWDQDDGDDHHGDVDDADLERDGGLVWGEKGVPVELALELLPVLAVHKLEHRLVHHVRLQIVIRLLFCLVTTMRVIGG